MWYTRKQKGRGCGTVLGVPLHVQLLEKESPLLVYHNHYHMICSAQSQAADWPAIPPCSLFDKVDSFLLVIHPQEQNLPGICPVPLGVFKEIKIVNRKEEN
jgi:hypothetical protein